MSPELVQLQTASWRARSSMRAAFATLVCWAAVSALGCCHHHDAVRAEVPELWEPALRHPDAHTIINFVLADWFRHLYPERLAGYYLPDLQAVGVPVADLPGGHLPEVPGVKFVGIKSRADAELVREMRGGCGIRFDWFQPLAGDRAKITFAHLQYLRHQNNVLDSIDGWSVRYIVRKTPRGWTVVSWEMES
jgi:hypothetical protein